MTQEELNEIIERFRVNGNWALSDVAQLIDEVCMLLAKVKDLAGGLYYKAAITEYQQKEAIERFSAEKVKGRWIHILDHNLGCEWNECFVCKQRVISYEEYSFCPYCGAIMKEDIDDAGRA